MDYNIIKISLGTRGSVFGGEAGVGGGQELAGRLWEEGFGVGFWSWGALEVFVDYR